MTVILHTEASPGWGGQEMRILREMVAMRARGHEVVLAVQSGGGLVEPTRRTGIPCYELPFAYRSLPRLLPELVRIVRRHRVKILNTHSSIDGWIGGCVGKAMGLKVVRTRHISTPVRKGLNSWVLYNGLADAVMTTCEATAVALRGQARLSAARCLSLPTGIDPEQVVYREEERLRFREELGVAPTDFLVGTLCFLRLWKGVEELLHAAKALEHIPDLKWVIVGSGVNEEVLRAVHRRLGLEKICFFAGERVPPYAALGAMDLFALLSRDSEGVSQASLQAAWLKRPLLTTTVGGLPEVCIEGETGRVVPPYASGRVAEAVLALKGDPELCRRMGERAHALVREKFLFSSILDKIETLYKKL